MTTIQIDELVQSICLYRSLPLIFHGYVFPFLLAYSGLIGHWLIFENEEDTFEVRMIILSVIGCLQILTCLCCHWSVHIRCMMTCRKERNIYLAEIVKVVPTNNNGSPELVKIQKDESMNSEINIIWFIFQKAKYIWDGEEKKKFIPLVYPIDFYLNTYYESRGLKDEEEICSQEIIYGKNSLQMDIPEFMELFKERATAPFFVFQLFCVGLWCLDEYWYYSLFTLFMLVIFECTLVQQQLRNMSEIRKMGSKPYKVHVFRCNRWQSLMSDQLMPADIVSISRCQNENLIPCDVLLLRGPCVVDESILTGESIPQMKEPLEGQYLDRAFDFSADSRLHVLFGGTKIVQHTSPAKNSIYLKAPDNGCICYVLQNGFSTSQGKLLRTILYGVSRVTANNLEAFGFILFLLIFAIAAASYVWIYGTMDPDRNRYKLFLECTLILTSVVPPELPIELSLAVNTSLLSLSKLMIFCTEPFRIPFAGKIDICCFDKTGTLTSDDLLVEGVAGLDGTCSVIAFGDVPNETIQVIATCHSLVLLDDGNLVGDPQEKATLKAIDWNLTKGDCVIPKKAKVAPMKIFHRFHFSSHLKRMSVIAGYMQSNSMDTCYIASVKGAPETLKKMFTSVPSNYDSIFNDLSRRGARILALGKKDLGKLSHLQVRELKRDDIERGLRFMGFVTISCPLKRDSKNVIKELLASSHSAVMITGDNSLTACHVANELKFTQRKHTLILENDHQKGWVWSSIDQSICLEFRPIMRLEERNEFFFAYDFCLTGDGLSWLITDHNKYFMTILPYVSIFARVAPKQKELIITTYRSLGFHTLMCGDGTNDVGALKHAHCGVAILSNAPDRLPSLKPSRKELIVNADTSMRSHAGIKFPINQERKLARKDKFERRSEAHILARNQGSRSKPTQKEHLEKLLKEFEEEQNQFVKLGDASIAAPFTSKLSSIQCVCNIIKQGRCTLVTTLQMFKILALNALVLAYSQSVLYLDGIKFSDYQATLQGLLLAACFLFISRSRPLKMLSKERPLSNIFNVYTILTVLLQFFVHFTCLIYLVHQAKTIDPRLKKVDIDKVFEPTLLNSTVYIISMALQISTFAINYRGNPFMENLRANKPLLISLLFAGGVVMMLAIGVSPELSAQFEIVDFPYEFRIILVQVLICDFMLSLIVDRMCLYLFGEGKLSSQLVRNV